MRGAVVTDYMQPLEVRPSWIQREAWSTRGTARRWVGIFGIGGVLRAVGKERQPQTDPGQSPRDEPDLPKGYQQIWDAIRALLTIEGDEDQHYSASQRNTR
jgi:hypothetical protein